MRSSLYHVYFMYIHGFSLNVSLVLVPDLMGYGTLSNRSKLVAIGRCPARQIGHTQGFPAEGG